ncbi:hypothetical protein [Actinoplanes aureus]|uniref:Uncharacterized protein n=1 Tax=Actinoplanes aureus TaxID=2792083 RepID=A0A931G2B2_9ACTN|nr:hypothetical protein [Actinoplanes aureus]MBG0567522.1 hypothetical protein [Actinoplanes aureus]
MPTTSQPTATITLDEFSALADRIGPLLSKPDTTGHIEDICAEYDITFTDQPTSPDAIPEPATTRNISREINDGRTVQPRTGAARHR